MLIRDENVDVETSYAKQLVTKQQLEEERFPLFPPLILRKQQKDKELRKRMRKKLSEFSKTTQKKPNW